MGRAGQGNPQAQWHALVDLARCVRLGPLKYLRPGLDRNLSEAKIRVNASGISSERVNSRPFNTSRINGNFFASRIWPCGRRDKSPLCIAEARMAPAEREERRCLVPV